MAKTALKNKAAGKPKFKVRAYTRCQVCGRPRRYEGQLVNIDAEGPRPDRL